MGSSEFTYWVEFMRAEAIGPGSDVARWAELMAGVCNGPVRKADKTMYRAADFLPRKGREPAKPKPASAKDARAFVQKLRGLTH